MAPRNTKKKGIQPWGDKCWAKKLLRDDILAGAVTFDSNPQDVYNMRVEYKPYEFNAFKKNLANLLEAIKRDSLRSRFDCELYGHDLAVLKQMKRDRAAANPDNETASPLKWHHSPAKKLLHKDVLVAALMELTPTQLHKTRPEYMAFDLKIFRNHLYQEKDAYRRRKFRMEKKASRAPRPPSSSNP